MCVCMMMNGQAYDDGSAMSGPLVRRLKQLGSLSDQERQAVEGMAFTAGLFNALD